MSGDPYGEDVLARPGSHRREIPTVTVRRGLLVEDARSGFVGEVVAARRTVVRLRDRRGREREFVLHPGGFYVDDRRVTLQVPERPAASRAPGTSASGSLAVADAAPRVARASRIYVEGTHDAELIERVWGHDLRVEGIVVEPLHGADDLAGAVAAFGPSPSRRLGVLLDHLVAGTKEHRLAAEAAGPDVLITGHPYVDVWEAVRPGAVGIDAWPQVPRGEDWKTGAARRLGLSGPEALWERVRGAVRDWRDLEQPLRRAVEELIDFVSLAEEP